MPFCVYTKNELSNDIMTHHPESRGKKKKRIKQQQNR